MILRKWQYTLIRGIKVIAFNMNKINTQNKSVVKKIYSKMHPVTCTDNIIFCMKQKNS